MSGSPGAFVFLWELRKGSFVFFYLAYMVLRTWVLGTRGLRGGAVSPLRGICAAIRWCSASAAPGAEPATVNDLLKQPEMLSRFDPSLIRNFRCALGLHSRESYRVAPNIPQPATQKTHHQPLFPDCLTRSNDLYRWLPGIPWIWPPDAAHGMGSNLLFWQSCRA